MTPSVESLFVGVLLLNLSKGLNIHSKILINIVSLPLVKLCKLWQPRVTSKKLSISTTIASRVIGII